jgi:parvulin-like peptidyl-prolyl isomerase
MDLLKVGDRILQSQDLIPLMSKTNLLSRLIQEVIIEDAIADIQLTADEVAAAAAEFCQRNKISSPEEANAWAQQQYGTPDLIRTTASREKKLAKFKQQTFAKEVESYFLQRKSRLDRVLYSLIRTTQVGLAQELYFRIHDDGQSFADLAREYSEGQEAKTGGLIGPVELSVPHPALAGLLSVSKPGQIWPPKRIGEWYVVVRLEKFFPAQMDDAMRERLQDELFQQWLREQLQNSPVSVPGMDTIAVAAREATGTPIAQLPLQQKIVDARDGTELSTEEAAPSSESSAKTAVPSSSEDQLHRESTAAAEATTEPAADPWS